MPSEPTLPEFSSSDTAPLVDLRGARRFDCPGHPSLGVVVCPLAAPVAVAVKDVSSNGIALLCDEPIEPGTPLTVLWQFGPVSRWRTLRAVAVRHVPQPDGGWIVGCAFAEWLDTGDVLGFLLYANEIGTRST
jgi:PilZ domain